MAERLSLTLKRRLFLSVLYFCCCVTSQCLGSFLAFIGDNYFIFSYSIVVDSLQDDSQRFLSLGIYALV